MDGQEDLQSRGGGGGDSDALRLVELQRWCHQDREKLIQKHPAIESEDPGAASSYPRGSQPGQASCRREEVLLFHPLDKGMATHFSTLAWKIPWTEEPGGLQSRGCKELDTTE